MIDSGALTAILAGVGAIIGSGGVVAIIHELSVRHKVKNESEFKKSEKTTELMNYFTDEIKRINEQTKESFEKLKEENAELRKEIKSLNIQITALVKWIMVDNATYRAWLENTLKSLNPNIDIPKCAEPPITWNIDEDSIEE